MIDLITQLSSGELLLSGCIGGMVVAFFLTFGLILIIVKLLFQTAMGRG